MNYKTFVVIYLGGDYLAALFYGLRKLPFTRTRTALEPLLVTTMRK